MYAVRYRSASYRRCSRRVRSDFPHKCEASVSRPEVAGRRSRRALGNRKPSSSSLRAPTQDARCRFAPARDRGRVASGSRASCRLTGNASNRGRSVSRRDSSPSRHAPAFGHAELLHERERVAAIGAGANNLVYLTGTSGAEESFIGAGDPNTIESYRSFVGAGDIGFVASDHAFVGRRGQLDSGLRQLLVRGCGVREPSLGPVQFRRRAQRKHERRSRRRQSCYREIRVARRCSSARAAARGRR